MITSCLNFDLDSRFILLVQTKKVISINMTAAQAAENHGDE